MERGNLKGDTHLYLFRVQGQIMYRALSQKHKVRGWGPYVEFLKGPSKENGTSRSLSHHRWLWATVWSLSHHRWTVAAPLFLRGCWKKISCDLLVSFWVREIESSLERRAAKPRGTRAQRLNDDRSWSKKTKWIECQDGSRFQRFQQIVTKITLRSYISQDSLQRFL